MAVGDTVLDYLPEFGATWAACGVRIASLRAGGTDSSAILTDIVSRFAVLHKGVGWPEDASTLTREQQLAQLLVRP